MTISNYRRVLVSGAIIASFLAPLAFAGATTTATSTPAMRKKTIDRACMQAATTKRDTAIIAALDASYNTLKAGLQTRSAAISAGWGIENQADRRAALKKAWDDWKQTAKSGRRTLTDARIAAWKQFQTDRKNCGPGAESDERSAQGAIDSGL